MLSIAKKIEKNVPKARLATDQPFRLSSIAFSRPESVKDRKVIVEVLQSEGLNITVNIIWIVGWFGDYDKLTMSRRVFHEVYDLDIDSMGDQIVYSGDSINDAPMFKFFRRSVCVSTVQRYLNDIPNPPTWITKGPGGVGFVEIADTVLKSKKML